MVAQVLVLDRVRRFRPLALQDPRAADLLPGMSEEERMASFHVVGADRTVRSAGEGLAEVLPPLRRFPRLAERGYWLVAGNRDRLGKLVPAAARRRAERRIRARADG